jgi:DNA replication licensing factor MCM7
VTIRGIVTRATDVQPLVTVVTYTCTTCTVEIFQEVHGDYSSASRLTYQVNARQFNPLATCPNPSCKGKNSGGFVARTRGCKFVKYQELRVQEMVSIIYAKTDVFIPLIQQAEQVPIGHVPRSLNVHIKGELTRQASAGDIVVVTGVRTLSSFFSSENSQIFLPTPHVNSRGMRSGLLADTYIEAHQIQKLKKNYTAYKMTLELKHQIEEFIQAPDPYGRLARSIAPEIFGHEDIKKALLLLMVSGVNRHMKDGLKIRGDINICLMGDPGVAKSQLLKHIATIVPRGVYTSGKGSSGVGLTAAVLKDPVTGDLVLGRGKKKIYQKKKIFFFLEGGSLVLADKGVCCIDEFDKMEDSDRFPFKKIIFFFHFFFFFLFKNSQNCDS